jgi:glycosyltransferase involved in cell wall biosynthesis
MRSLVYLPPPVRVLSLDLALPIVAIRDCAGWGAVRVLVHLGSRPFGWLTIESPGDIISVGEILTALRSQLSEAVQEVALDKRLGGPQRAAMPPARDGWPPISVIVCTRDRTGFLARCLASLQALDYPDYEIIVVDNAPTSDDTRQLTASLPVRYLREDRPGLDWARNRGIAEARHELVAFTDDDVRVDPGWLRYIAPCFADPEVMLATGLVAPAELATAAQITFEYGYGGMGKGIREQCWRGSELDPTRLLGAHHLGVGANMTFRRAVFDRVGPFDTALDVGTPSHGGGDLDMFHRVLRSGATVRYQPRALVWHFHRRDLAALRRQLGDNGRAFGVYLITRWFEAGQRSGGVSRGAVSRYTIETWFGWLVGRVVRRLFRREVLSLPLQAAELRGALEAPWAYWATRRRDRRLRADRPSEGAH